MIDFEALRQQGRACGFTHVARLDPVTIELREDVRAMCASGKCRMYGKSWSCPPACGTLEELRARISRYREGILVQTVGQLEDSMDGEGMMEAEALHKQHFSEMHALLRKDYPELMAIGAGTCTRCKQCSYPDAPCRFPDRMTSSMEALGMLVLEVCKNNDLTYYYGPNTIAYTSCFLLK